MHHRTPKLFWLVCAWLAASTAHARSPWVGRWFSVPEASRRSPHSFSLSRPPGGGLRYDDGGEVYFLAPGGRAAPEPFQPAATIVADDLTSTSFSFVEFVGGRPTRRVRQRLSRDGLRLLGRRTSIAADGRETTRELVSVRVGRGRGLAGRWRQPPPPRATTAGSPSSARPFWIVTETAAGLVTWTIPETGEVLEGRADGRAYPVAGALALPGRTFTLKTLAPRHLLWSFYENGHLVEHAEERLSTDGELWTDLVWKPRYPSERDRFVYRKNQPTGGPGSDR